MFGSMGQVPSTGSLSIADCAPRTGRDPSLSDVQSVRLGCLFRVGKQYVLPRAVVEDVEFPNHNFINSLKLEATLDRPILPK